jgi:hypothetical protein
MAPPPNLDRVQAVKWESSAKGGTDEDAYPVGMDETADALSARGLYGQSASGPADEDVLIWRDGSDWKFQDKTTGPLTLTQLNSQTLRQTILAALTANTTTTSTSFVTLLTQNITIGTGGIIIAQVTAGISNATANRGVALRLLINGSARCGTADRLPVVNTSAGFPLQWRVSGLSAGTYAVTVEWRTLLGGTAQCRPVAAPDSEHCALLVSEVTA